MTAKQMESSLSEFGINVFHQEFFFVWQIFEVCFVIVVFVFVFAVVVWSSNPKQLPIVFGIWLWSYRKKIVYDSI